MADYKELLRRAVEALPENNGAARRAVYEKAHMELEEATEMLLQVQSNRADASVKLIESIFQVAAWLKRTWPAMDETAREQWGPVLNGYEESRERWLAVCRRSHQVVEGPASPRGGFSAIA